MAQIESISGHIVDILNKKITKGVIQISDGKINNIVPAADVANQFILPGFIDAHIHIESSMLTPVAFADVAVKHGTVATISDPHEIANVCGIEGVSYMIENAKSAKHKIFFGAPSCVPATTFESAGAVLDATAVDKLLASDDIWYLSEMMNYPGVLHGDLEVMAKIESAKLHDKPVDGHAPGLRGDSAKTYIDHGISTDHECVTLEEALDKLKYGMKIIIREGSAAKNFDALHTLISSHPENVMFCSDDKHPDDLIKGHINLLVKKSLDLGYDLFDVLRIACINPLKHYKVPVGMLNIGNQADFIVVDNLKDFNVLQTVINGFDVISSPKNLDTTTNFINHFNISDINLSDLKGTITESGSTPVIVAIDGSLVTEKMMIDLPQSDGYTLPDVDSDILKICVVNRYTPTKPAIGFVKGFGLKNCAIASTVAHDSHNIIAVGDDDVLIYDAINLLIESKGGLSAVSTHEKHHLPLPIAGLMSDKSCHEVGKAYSNISQFAKNHGSTLHAPFMTLSFMALLVIPKIKISDKGMFDAEAFCFY
jgi:adenine deaminase